MGTKYDGRIDKLEQKISKVGQLPASLRGPYPIWRDPDSTDDDIKLAEEKIKERLLAGYGTCSGARFFSLGWGTKSEWDNTLLVGDRLRK